MFSLDGTMEGSLIMFTSNSTDFQHTLNVAIDSVNKENLIPKKLAQVPTVN
jgi:hypothetical protein